MHYFIFLVFLTFAIPASAGELVNKYLNKEEDVFLRTADAWCVSAGALESKRRIFSHVYNEVPEGRSQKPFFRNKKPFIEKAKKGGNEERLELFETHRPLLDEAQNCHDLAEFEEKILEKNLKKPEALKNAVLGDENKEAHFIGAAWVDYCSDSHLNDAKARIAAVWYEGQRKYFKGGRSGYWLKGLRQQAKSRQMANVLKSKKDELFSQSTCVDLRNFIHNEIRAFAQANGFWN